MTWPFDPLASGPTYERLREISRLTGMPIQAAGRTTHAPACYWCQGTGDDETCNSQQLVIYALPERPRNSFCGWLRKRKAAQR